MEQRLNRIDGSDFTRMVVSGAAYLANNVEGVNRLNVFPVPDGDTGTNMNLTLTSGVAELQRRPSEQIGKAAEALAKGLLMGARGNSGVILSQLFRGFAKSVQGQRDITSQQLAAALQSGVETAYKAVVKPVEGTILTVSREAAKHGVAYARRTSDVLELMKEVVKQGNQALSKTPDYLPVLKQVGVVDAGGKGLMLIYEGFVAALAGEMADNGTSSLGDGDGTGDVTQHGHAAPVPAAFAPADRKPGHGAPEPRRAQAMLATEDIEHGYCTEFMVKLAPGGRSKGLVFDENAFRDQLGKHGDSLLVVADDELVKVHIHAEHPGDVMNLAMRYGELTRIKIENMREQHSHIIEEEAEETAEGILVAPDFVREPAAAARKPYGFVAVSAGDGISDIFRSLGVDVVLFGGQTMNPSTENIAAAVSEVEAETVFILPNNSNIVMAAQQVKDVVEDKRVVVVPSKSIPQGIAAMLAFREGGSADANETHMIKAMSGVESGQVTHAVRDTQIDGIDIQEGDYIGIHNGRIVSAHSELLTSCEQLLEAMVAGGTEIVTVYTGGDASEEQTGELMQRIGERYPDVELELHAGGQPVYYYIFSAE